MIHVLIVSLLLLYYWYFYADFSQSVPKPSNPSRPSFYDIQLLSKETNHFMFVSKKRDILWEHYLPNNPYAFSRNQIVHQGPCYHVSDGSNVVAKGQVLYEYLKKNSELSSTHQFQQSITHTLRNGNIFYFTCFGGHIDALYMCPSGSIFIGNKCEPINPCKEKPNGTRTPHPDDMNRYIECIDEKQVIRTCPKDTFFYLDKCLDKNDIQNFCLFNQGYKIINKKTKLECRNKTPHYVYCPPGERFFDQPYCEPDDCENSPDQTKLPLPEQYLDPFLFIPGYKRCFQSKVAETVECPQVWDDMLTRGDNLTSLPMVFDGQKCSIPTFCENVFSNEPNVIVPVHEFTKHVKNWSLAPVYDSTSGYVCENKRKRINVPDGMRISKKFKLESACESSSSFLPVYQSPTQYYDCATQSTAACPDAHFFNGTRCVPEPQFPTFTFQNLPLFHFNSFLNTESWIPPVGYKDGKKDLQCTDPESTYLELYDLCSHPECEHLAFLSTIPDLALLLPREKQAKCQFNETTRRLQKIPVPFPYRFWEQREVPRDLLEDEYCMVGQHPKTGHFIWDRTLFATCNPAHPFLFCPASDHVIQVEEDRMACAPPASNEFPFSSTEHTYFTANEIQSIQSLNAFTEIVLWKGVPPIVLSENEILEIPPRSINMTSTQPINVSLKNRVTYPPNYMFEYDMKGEMTIKTAPEHYGYLPKLKAATTKSLNFPRYKPDNLVDAFLNHYLIIE